MDRPGFQKEQPSQVDWWMHHARRVLDTYFREEKPVWGECAHGCADGCAPVCVHVLVLLCAWVSESLTVSSMQLQSGTQPSCPSRESGCFCKWSPIGLTCKL